MWRLGLYPLEIEGVEGDDVIATLVDRLCGCPSQHQEDQGQPEECEFEEVVVATVDKDLLQVTSFVPRLFKLSPAETLVSSCLAPTASVCLSSSSISHRLCLSFSTAVAI